MKFVATTSMKRTSLSPFGRVVHRLGLPNVLTTVRIVLIPLFLWLILTSGSWAEVGHPDKATRWWLIVFVLLMFTDQLDGFLARKYEVITDFGKLADPIADKALMISALVSLNILGELWWWVTAVIVVRELGITVWRMVLAGEVEWCPRPRVESLRLFCRLWLLRFTSFPSQALSHGRRTLSWELRCLSR